MTPPECNIESENPPATPAGPRRKEDKDEDKDEDKEEDKEGRQSPIANEGINGAIHQNPRKPS